MSWTTVIWEEGEDGNIEHIAEHDLTPDDVDFVLANPVSYGTSKTSGRPIVFGFTPDGRWILVVIEEFEDVVYPVTAFETRRTE